MIVANGTGLKRATRQFIVRNWALILLVLFSEEIVFYTSKFSDVLQTDVFSATAVGLLATVVGIFFIPMLYVLVARIFWSRANFRGKLAGDPTALNEAEAMVASTTATPRTVSANASIASSWQELSRP